jgi:hypothetical protein
LALRSNVARGTPDRVSTGGDDPACEPIGRLYRREMGLPVSNSALEITLRLTAVRGSRLCSVSRLPRRGGIGPQRRPVP